MSRNTFISTTSSDVTSARCIRTPSQSQAAARGIKLQVWLVCQIGVPMGNTKIGLETRL